MNVFCRCLRFNKYLTIENCLCVMKTADITLCKLIRKGIIIVNDKKEL